MTLAETIQASTADLDRLDRARSAAARDVAVSARLVQEAAANVARIAADRAANPPSPEVAAWAARRAHRRARWARLLH